MEDDNTQTQIQITKDTAGQLKEIGNMKDTYETVILRLIAAYNE